MDVLIYGAGAIGSFTGYLLSEAGTPVENVALLGRKGHIQRIRERELKIDLVNEKRDISFKYCFSSLDELRRSGFSPELVIISVKAYSIREVGVEIKESGALKDSTFILLMNGMGNKEALNLQSVPVFEGMTYMGVRHSGDGSIELKGAGKSVYEHGIDPDIKRFMKDMYEGKGFEIEFSKDFRREQWRKLFVNSVINPITALTGKENGIVLSNHLQKTVEEIISECLSVSLIEGFEFDKADVLHDVLSVASKTSRNTSSMLQDVSRGRRTEIDSINGFVLKLAERHCLKAHVNETLFSLVKAIEEKK